MSVTWSSSSSTMMLPLLLLPLFLSFDPASSLCRGRREFYDDVVIFGRSVQNCSENCNSVNITDGPCRCLNLNKSRAECDSPEYAIKALQSLHESISQQEATRKLVKTLSMWKTSPGCWVNKTLCWWPVNLSPKSLHKKLEDLALLQNSRK